MKHIFYFLVAISVGIAPMGALADPTGMSPYLHSDNKDDFTVALKAQLSTEDLNSESLLSFLAHLPFGLKVANEAMRSNNIVLLTHDHAKYGGRLLRYAGIAGVAIQSGFLLAALAGPAGFAVAEAAATNTKFWPIFKKVWAENFSPKINAASLIIGATSIVLLIAAGRQNVQHITEQHMGQNFVAKADSQQLRDCVFSFNFVSAYAVGYTMNHCANSNEAIETGWIHYPKPGTDEVLNIVTPDRTTYNFDANKKVFVQVQ